MKYILLLIVCCLLVTGCGKNAESSNSGGSSSSGGNNTSQKEDKVKTGADYKDDENLNSFYDEKGKHVTLPKDIRDLDVNYSIENAKSDGCYIKSGNNKYNEDVYDNFISKYKDNAPCFIRLVQTTVDGDITITDYFYNPKYTSLEVVTDTTRDKQASNKNRVIKYKNYDASRLDVTKLI